MTSNDLLPKIKQTKTSLYRQSLVTNSKIIKQKKQKQSNQNKNSNIEESTQKIYKKSYNSNNFRNSKKKAQETRNLKNELLKQRELRTQEINAQNEKEKELKTKLFQMKQEIEITKISIQEEINSLNEMEKEWKDKIIDLEQKINPDDQKQIESNNIQIKSLDKKLSKNLENIEKLKNFIQEKKIPEIDFNPLIFIDEMEKKINHLMEISKKQKEQLISNLELITNLEK
ncbi:hypothetical protein M0811_08815 [Anaeramoeba ignava]|uniref:Uncharacterized protein n=1 Tax=Anaeramoeba ignava TaxID=1746090 RepID=A0A9Q0RAS5_ANAIG|nr:hypothetical protein M0811_08815 [Anaeramoeba ignava]